MSTLSILTTSTGRSRRWSLPGTLPVRGQVAGAAAAPVGLADVRVALGVGDALGLSWPPQAVSTSDSAVTSEAIEAREALRDMAPTVCRGCGGLFDDPP